MDDSNCQLKEFYVQAMVKHLIWREENYKSENKRKH